MASVWLLLPAFGNMEEGALGTPYGPIVEYAFVAKGKNFERDEAEIMRHIHSIRRIISAKSQPKFLPCSRNDIRQ